MERASELCLRHGYWGMINLPSWMFLSSFQVLREKLISNQTINSLLHLGRGIFGSDFGSVAFTIRASAPGSTTKAQYRRLFDKHVQVRSPETIRKLFLEKEYRNFLTLQNDLSKIPGSPLVYWVNEKTFDIFQKGKPLGSHADVKRGMTTSDNGQFLRYWPEVSNIKSNRVSKSHSEAKISGAKWFPYSKGGGYRKWYGYLDFYVNWEDDGRDVIKFAKTINKSYTRTIVNVPYYFSPSVGFSYVTAGPFSVRMIPEGCLYDSGGPGVFAKQKTRNEIIACMNSAPAIFLLGLLNPTVNLQIADVVRLPLPIFYEGYHIEYDPLKIEKLLNIGKNDWDSYETSWDFNKFPLIKPDYRQPTLKTTYQKLRAHWREMTLEMQRLEEENNRIFIDAYGLQDELTPEVPLNEITLTCNPHYRYQLSGQWLVASDQQKEEELEKRLLEDTIKELVSYAVGCMFGRYSLDMPGLVLANQGETLADYLHRVAEYRQTLATSHWPPATNQVGENHEREALQGADRVAEGHGSSAVGLSSNQGISQGRAVRVDQPGTSGSCVDSIQHSGGSSASILSGVQKLSIDSEGFVGGNGNPTTDRNAAQLSNSGTTSTHHGGTSGNQQNDSSADGKTGHWPLDTSHLSFVPDEDNVIPLLEGDWFTDDIAERFKQFLKVAFGADYYEENLRFVEESLNIKGKRNYSIRDYFLGEFYTDHVKRYKKRPIYWLFSSPKGSFNALIYMHRYRPDTVSVVLNDYLREFRTKLTAHKSHLEAVSISGSASQGEKTKALKEIESLRKVIDELDGYEGDILYPLATEQLEIDLDDGVKANYPQFGAALKKIVGLDAAED